MTSFIDDGFKLSPLQHTHNQWHYIKPWFGSQIANCLEVRKRPFTICFSIALSEKRKPDRLIYKLDIFPCWILVMNYYFTTLYIITANNIIPKGCQGESPGSKRRFKTQVTLFIRILAPIKTA